MQITVNDQPRTLSCSLSLTELLHQMDIPEAGTAVALNLNVVPRSSWPTHQVSDGDRIMIIRATAGG